MGQIPLFITKKLKKQLIDIGYNNIMLKYMKPEEAWNILEGDLSMNDYVFNKIYDILDLKPPNKSKPKPSKIIIDQEIKNLIYLIEPN